MAASSLIWALIALIFPPLPVAIRKGCSGHLVLNIALLLLAWIPAVLHAWYVILEYDSHGQRQIDKRIRRAKERDEDRVAALEGKKQQAPVWMGMGMGNQQGWYAPPPQPEYQPVAKEAVESQWSPPQQVPEYARDVKQAPDYARDAKQRASVGFSYRSRSER